MILYVCAMEEEARLIKEQLSQDEVLIVTGVGKVNAARGLTEAIKTYEIELIVNLGFAGANDNFEVFDIVMIDDARYHDVDLTMFNYEKGQIPGYPVSYKPEEIYIKKIKNLIQTVKQGRLMTGDYFMTADNHQACIYDMEGAALYQVAHYYHIPLISLKVVSDVVGSTHHLKNYQKFEAYEGAKALYNVYKALKGGLI